MTGIARGFRSSAAAIAVLVGLALEFHLPQGVGLRVASLLDLLLGAQAAQALGD
jgi:hypothetical protein